MNDSQVGSSESSTRGGHSHRRRVQSCDRGQDAVKRSRHFLGVGQTVKQCAGHYLRIASNQALPLRAQLFKRGKIKEGESLEDLDHVLDMDDGFWTWFSISGRYRPRTTTANANYDSAVFLMACVNDRRSGYLLVNVGPWSGSSQEPGVPVD